MAIKTQTKPKRTPKGTPAVKPAKDRAARRDQYREARDAYAAIRELRKEELDRRAHS